MFITAECVNSVTQAWTFSGAVFFFFFCLPACLSRSAGRYLPDPLNPWAVLSNQRRAALIAWPWQEASWSGTGHHLPRGKVTPHPLFVHSHRLSFPITFCHNRALVRVRFLNRCWKVTSAAAPQIGIRFLIERTADIRCSPLSTPDNGPLISVYLLYTLASTSRCSRKGSALIYAVYIHQAHAKPISHCQNGACGILSPQGAVTEQVLFHYPLSGQSLILPLCSRVMLFISVVCALGFHISGSLCQDPNPFEPEFGHYHVVCIKDCRATFPPFSFFFFLFSVVYFWLSLYIRGEKNILML